MNKTFFTSTVVFALCYTTIIAHAQKKTETITGRWKVDIEETIRRTNKVSHDKIDKMPARGQEGLRRAFANREYDFGHEQQLRITLKVKDETKNLKGNWKYDKRKNVLVTTLQDKSRSFLVKWEGSDFITLDYGKKQGDTGTLEVLCLRRAN